MSAWYTEESEMAQAKIKGLDETGPFVNKTPVRKDVNTFINNQLKFPSSQPASLPPYQMKCNILKAKVQEQHKMGECKGGAHSEGCRCNIIKVQEQHVMSECREACAL